MNKKVIGLVLQHKCPVGEAFDFFVLEKLEKEYKELFEGCYQVNCNHANKFLKENPEFVFMGSEDLGHINLFNNGVRSLIQECLDKGFILKIEMEEVK